LELETFQCFIHEPNPSDRAWIQKRVMRTPRARIAQQKNTYFHPPRPLFNQHSATRPR